MNFSVTPLTPLPNYLWTASNGAITGGQGSNNVDITWGTGAGNITVRASNTCGASSSRTRALPLPDAGRKKGSQQLAVSS